MMNNIKKYARIFELNKVEDLLEELEDEAFWLCTARAEEQKGIKMW